MRGGVTPARLPLFLTALSAPLAHFDYQFGYRKFDSAEGPRAPKYMNITYYFDNVSSTELYGVDQELLKDYIKRQMCVATFCLGWAGGGCLCTDQHVPAMDVDVSVNIDLLCQLYSWPIQGPVWDGVLGHSP